MVKYDAFSSLERPYILNTLVPGKGGKRKLPDGRTLTVVDCRDTIDKVFILSVDEATTCLASDQARRVRNSKYIVGKSEKGARSRKPYPEKGTTASFTYGFWWLRDINSKSGDMKNSCGFHVVSTGGIGTTGQLNLGGYVIRPAIWVDMSYWGE